MDRTRFGTEVISVIKASAPELAVLVRINGSDLVPGGLDVTDAVAVAGAFTDAGADALVVSAGVYGSVPYTIPLLDDPEGTFLDLGAKFRSEVDIPVVGAVVSPDPLPPSTPWRWGNATPSQWAERSLPIPSGQQRRAWPT